MVVQVQITNGPSEAAMAGIDTTGVEEEDAMVDAVEEGRDQDPFLLAALHADHPHAAGDEGHHLAQGAALTAIADDLTATAADPTVIAVVHIVMVVGPTATAPTVLWDDLGHPSSAATVEVDLGRDPSRQDKGSTPTHALAPTLGLSKENRDMEWI